MHKLILLQVSKSLTNKFTIQLAYRMTVHFLNENSKQGEENSKRTYSNPQNKYFPGSN